MKRIVLGVVAGLLIALGPWPGPVAQAASVVQYVCRDAFVQDLGATGSAIRPVSCGREFSVSDPYLVLYARIDNVDAAVTMTTELVDPAGATVLSQRYFLTPIEGSRTAITIAFVLPLAAAVRDLPEKLSRSRVIVPAGTPARERPGEWTWRMALSPGSSSAVHFTLKP